MKILLKVIVCLMAAWMRLLPVMGIKGGPVKTNCNRTSVMAHHGGSVTINCKYQEAQESSIKYFCKEDGNFDCTNVISAHTSEYTKRERFSLTDNKQQGVYTVVISTLTKADAGTYQCAMKSIKNSIVCLTKIHLRILNWNDTKLLVVASRTSETAHIRCYYPDSHEDDDKLLCKGENPYNCEEVIGTTEQDRHVVKDRFDIRDNKRTKYFNVNINNLSKADSGTYWCGSGRPMQHPVYTKIHLSVDERRIKTKNSDTPAPHEIPRSHNKDKNNTIKPAGAVYAGFAVCLAMIVASVITIIVYIWKPLWTQVCCAVCVKTNTGYNTEGNDGDIYYEQIDLQNQPASPVSSVYATVNHPTHHEASTLPDTYTNGSSASITRVQGATTPAEQPPLYSNLTNLWEL